jgi:SAM-dependent methyltransferase
MTYVAELRRGGTCDVWQRDRIGLGDADGAVIGGNPMQRREHWDLVFNTKGERQVSWFEALPAVSLRMMESAGLTTGTCVVDIGGGESRLVDQLAARGLDCLAVLDVSGAALTRARTRLGSVASLPIWLEADVTGNWSLKPMDIWHDRAVFHFLISADDRGRYRSHLLDTLKPGGFAIVATFALDGPDRCSGLPVQRYSPATLSGELGPDLRMIESQPHIHTTPWGSQQSFVYCRFQRLI